MLFPFQQITTIFDISIEFLFYNSTFSKLLPNFGEECINLLEVNRLFNPFERLETQFADKTFKYPETLVKT